MTDQVSVNHEGRYFVLMPAGIEGETQVSVGGKSAGYHVTLPDALVDELCMEWLAREPADFPEGWCGEVGTRFEDVKPIHTEPCVFLDDHPGKHSWSIREDQAEARDDYIRGDVEQADPRP